jgi:ADP-ribosylglycohydrolase
MGNMYLDGIMGLVVGDALGVPCKEKSRDYMRNNPVNGMVGLDDEFPAGTWSDDSSMTLATLDSLKDGYNPEDIMKKFVEWLYEDEYTPNGNGFGAGDTCAKAIEKYDMGEDLHTCGGTKERDNGNGSLMRILPICLYCIDKDFEMEEAVEKVHEVSALTHAHIRSKIACGLYYFIAQSIIKNSGSLEERIQSGIDDGFAYYESKGIEQSEIDKYSRIRNLKIFKQAGESEIRTTGYVVDTLETALWAILNTDTYRDCELKVVNLGGDADSIAVVSGGLAGLYYGYDAIPDEWLKEIAKRDWIEDLCKNFKC